MRLTLEPPSPASGADLFIFFFALRNPNPSRSWAESVLPRWQPVLSSEAPPTYLELSTNLHHQRGLSQSSCSFWTQLAPKLTSLTGDRDFYWFLLVSPVPSVCSSAVSPEVLSPRSTICSIQIFLFPVKSTFLHLYRVYRIIIVNFDSQLRAVTQQRVRETIFLTFLFPLVSRCIGGGACSACTDR